MPDLTISHKMTAYMAWADDVMLKNAEQLSATELSIARDTLFQSITGTFDHILVVAEIFKAHLEGLPHSHTGRIRSESLPFSEVAQRLRSINDFYVSCARNWTEDEMAEIIAFEFVDGGEGRMRREDILLHVVNHATYHRGFISTLIFPMKIETKASDLTVFLRDVWSKTMATS